MELTKTDFTAIETCDSEYILIKGNKLEKEGDIESAIKYYELAATMGNIQAISEIGAYYVDKNISLAKAYLNMAAEEDNISALYKLGYIYKYIEIDDELSGYYFSKALENLGDLEEEKYMYPSLFYELGLKFLDMPESIQNLYEAYDSLMIAKIGFASAIENGLSKFEENFKTVNELLEDERFEEVREIYEEMEDECDDGCDDECHCGHCH